MRPCFTCVSSIGILGGLMFAIQTSYLTSLDQPLEEQFETAVAYAGLRRAQSRQLIGPERLGVQAPDVLDGSRHPLGSRKRVEELD